MGTKRNPHPAKIERFRDRDEWIMRMLGGSLSAPAKIVTTCLALHLNIDKGRLEIASDTLAAETNYSERHVRRVIAEIESAGWIGVTRSVGRCHHYQLMMPDPGHLMSGQQRRERREQRGTARAARCSPILLFPPQGAAGAAEDPSLTQPDPPAGFKEFWTVYPKKTGEAAAKREYEKALKAGTTADEINAGARRYAADPERIEQSREGDRFTKNANNWLRDRRWTDKPTSITIDQHGNPVAAARSWKRNGSGNIHEAAERVKAEEKARRLRLIDGGRS